MYLTYDWILIGLYGVISFFLLLFAAYAAKEWRFERRQKIANVHAAQAEVRTWNVVRGDLVVARPSRAAFARSQPAIAYRAPGQESGLKAKK
jgi:hypothetical protein